MQMRHNHPVRRSLTPLHRRGISWCRTATTTPSDRTAVCCSRSIGMTLCRPSTTTPSGYARHPSTGGELFVQMRHNHPVRLRHRVQNRHNHPVRLRLPPLHRRGIVCAEPPQPPRQAAPATPPQEGNCLCRCGTTTPSGCACHPSTGGELFVQMRHNHPVRLRLPPLHRRGIVCADAAQPPRQAAPATPPQEGNCLCRCGTTTPSGCACHPSTGGELFVQMRLNHPVRLRLPPLHRRGIICADAAQPPRQAAPDTPPQEGNCLCRHDTTTPSGEA